MIETIKGQKGGVVDVNEAVRYSYLVSISAEQEVGQLEAYSQCNQGDADTSPETYCVDTISASGQFQLYSTDQKAQTCQETVESFNAAKSTAIPGTKNDADDTCAYLTVYAYKAYNWFVNDLQDQVISRQMSQMTATLAQVSGGAD